LVLLEYFIVAVVFVVVGIILLFECQLIFNT